MTSQELHQLIADNNTWMSRPENQGLAMIVQFRSSQCNQRRPITTDGRQSDITAVTARGRKARTPLRQRGLESRERSRSPLRQVPAEPSKEPSESSRDDSGSSDTATEFRRPFSVPPNRRPREFPAARGSPVQLQQTNRIYNILQRQGMGVMTPPPQMRPPSPPAQYLLQERQQTWREQQIRNLPTKAVTSQEEAESCVICMTEYETGEDVTVLPCNHCFHQGCISTWLCSNLRCPLCRKQCFLLKFKSNILKLQGRS